MAMQLDDGVQGSVAPSYVILWANSDDVPINLTGATLSGTIRDAAGTVRAIAGDLVITDAEAGAFRWDFAPADVADAGHFTVQFVATLPVGPSPALSKKAGWTIEASQFLEEE